MPRVSISTRHAPIRAVAARAAASSAAQVCASWAGLCCHSGEEGGVVLVMRPAYRRMRTYDLGHSGLDQPRRVTETAPATDPAMLVGDHPECPQWTKDQREPDQLSTLTCLALGTGLVGSPSTEATGARAAGVAAGAQVDEAGELYGERHQPMTNPAGASVTTMTTPVS